MKIFLLSAGLITGLGLGALGGLWAVLAWPTPVLDSISTNCSDNIGKVAISGATTSVNLCSLADGFVLGQMKN